MSTTKQSREYYQKHKERISVNRKALRAALKEAKPKPISTVIESPEVIAKRKYQAKYYQEHKEKAKEYQRLYNLTHKKKKGDQENRKAEHTQERRPYDESISFSRFQHTAPEKLAGLVKDFIVYKRLFTM